jgi:hypothetical protein
MKRLLLLASLLVVSVAQAQEIACPKFYPAEDTVLNEVPYQHSGKGSVRKQELSGAGWMAGAFNDTFGEMAGGSVKVKGGVDIAVPTFATWFVCWYGGGRAVAWWEELKPGILKGKDCQIQVRNKTSRDPMNIRLICK